MNEWKFYSAVINKCKEREDKWASLSDKGKEILFNSVYAELAADEDTVLDCLD